jgi:transcription elongation factor Elf1
MPVFYAWVETGMPTPRRSLAELKRRRHVLGRQLRVVVHCPVCRGEIRVIAYREHTCRVECKRCGLRWSFDPVAVGEALVAHADEIGAVQGVEGGRVARRGKGIIAAVRFGASPPP